MASGKRTGNDHSTKAYLRDKKARRLPWAQCLVQADWQTARRFTAVAARQHISGNDTYTIFTVDLDCCGIIDVSFQVNAPSDALKSILASYVSCNIRMIDVEYDLLHNILYGAHDFAADYGIRAHADWALARFILEDDTDEIPIIEIPLGVNDQPCLHLFPDNPQNEYYLRQLQKHAGEGGFQVVDHTEPAAE